MISPVIGSTTPSSSDSGTGSMSWGPLLRVALTGRGDRVGLEPAGLVERQDAAHLVEVLVARVEPGVPVLALEDQRLPVVDAVQAGLGVGGDDREGRQPGLGVVAVRDATCRARTRRDRRSPPTLPSARWVKNGCLRGLPLASLTAGDFCHSYQPSAGTRQRRDAAALANDALLQHRLGPGVDHPHADLGVLGPARHQAPREQPQLAHGRCALGIPLLGLGVPGHPA